MKRGTLTGTPPTGISGTSVRELDYTLDPTGNWRRYTPCGPFSPHANQIPNFIIDIMPAFDL
jgi:hypothetical protein